MRQRKAPSFLQERRVRAVQNIDCCVVHGSTPAVQRVHLLDAASLVPWHACSAKGPNITHGTE